MKNVLKPNSLRACRDLIKGRSNAFVNNEHIVADYAALRFSIKQQYPPMRGERLRKTILLTIGTLTALLSLYILIAA